MILLRAFLLIALAFHPFSVSAAGFIDHVSGVPYRWAQGSPIAYKVDPGDFSVAIPNATARGMIQDAFSIWSSVPIVSGLSFQYAGLLAEEVNSTNYLNYFTIDSDGLFRITGSDSLMIFDLNGGILADLFGGTVNYILGLSSPGGYDPATKTISKGLAIFNGAAPGVTAPTLKATMTHEFGHLLNLSHTQLNWNAGDETVLPTMFPYLPDDPDVLLTLERDDQFSLAYLYPHPTQYAAQASVSGRISRRNGSSVRGVFVSCRSVASPSKNAVSWVSDQTLDGSGGYLCGNLPAGPVTVEIEPVATAINLFDPDPPVVATEYYSGASESWDPSVDTRGSKDSVLLVSGRETKGIDLILNEDGRLRSGIAATGALKDFPWLSREYSELDHFIQVPSGASKVKFELKAADSTVDLDLYGRCDAEFALTGDPNVGTSVPIYSKNSASQAEFSSTGSGGSETVELTAASSPKLKACVYHLFVVNNSTRSTSFSLTATITGGAPKFNVGRGGKGEVDDGTGEILVMNRKLTGTGDSFVLRSLSVTDLGVGDMGRVEKGVLYADSDGSDSLTPGDRVLQEVTEIDRAGRRIVFSGLHEVFEADLPQTYLLTYTVRATSGGGIFLSLLLAGLAAAMWRSGRRGVGILLLTLIGLSCASEARQFHPTVTGGADVSVVGETFGDEVSVTVQSLTPTSVKDYFE